MSKPYLSHITEQLSTALDSGTLLTLAKETGFCQRQRLIHPADLFQALLAGLGSGQMETLADLYRGYIEISGTAVGYKSFHDRLAVPAFADFMRRSYEHLVKRLYTRALRALPGNPFGEFEAIWAHDGTSFALHDSLAGDLPGRFTKIKPAAVEIHATLDLLTDACARVEVSADRRSERDFLPAPEDLTRKLLLADRGYGSKRYFQRVDAACGNYLIRAQGHWNPVVVGIWRDGRLQRVPRRRLHTWLKQEQGPLLDLAVAWNLKPGCYVGRVVAARVGDGTWLTLCTNLPASHFSADAVAAAYRLRWQVELLFKEWKSYANLHGFETRHPALALGLIWAGMAAAALKRFLAYAAQLVHGVAISTRRTAMSCGRWLFALVAATPTAWRGVVRDCLAFLARVAPCSQPARERRRGRLRLGFAPRTRLQAVPPAKLVWPGRKRTAS